MGVHFYEGIWSWYRFVKAVWGWVSIFENEIQIGMDTNLGGGGCLYQNFRISRLTPTGFVWKMHTPPDLTLVYDDLKPKGCLWYVFHILKKMFAHFWGSLKKGSTTKQNEVPRCLLKLMVAGSRQIPLQSPPFQQLCHYVHHVQAGKRRVGWWLLKGGRQELLVLLSAK